MDSFIFVFLQYLLPKKRISDFIGFFAKSKNFYIKSIFINTFQKIYQVNLKEAVKEDIKSYSNFNSFFTRSLKPDSRPIDNNVRSITSPADGVVSQLGKINLGKVIQAKGMYFSLLEFLGNDKKYFEKFKEGLFATIYLSPKDYHRVHMPIDGKLKQMIYVPGKLFSVNKITSQSVKNLYSKNERLICFFDTARGPIAVTMVGAMIVSGIIVRWEKEDCFNKEKYKNFLIHLLERRVCLLKKEKRLDVLCWGQLL